MINWRNVNRDPKEYNPDEWIGTCEECNEPNHILRPYGENGKGICPKCFIKGVSKEIKDEKVRSLLLSILEERKDGGS